MNLDVKTFLRRLRTPRKTAREFVLVRPGREWLFGLLSASCVFLSCSAFAGFLFYTSLRNIDNGSGVETVPVQLYAHESVEKALKMYRDKRAAFDAVEAVSSAEIPRGNTASGADDITEEREAVEATSSLPVAE